LSAGTTRRYRSFVSSFRDRIHLNTTIKALKTLFYVVKDGREASHVSGQKPDDQNDKRYNKKRMDQPAPDLETEAQEPHNEKYSDYYP